MKVSILLLASGRGDRLGAGTPKAFVDCADRPLILRSLDRLAEVTNQRELIVAVHPDDRKRYVAPLAAEFERLGVDRVVDGGDTRQESMFRAFDASSNDHQLVLVHDAARPFFPVTATRTALERAAGCGAAILGVPVADTLKRVDSNLGVIETLDRSAIWIAQTPQIIRRDVLTAAIAHARSSGFTGTDDASLLEHAGLPVEVVPGDPRNFKITTPEDLDLATARIRAGDA